MTETEKQPEATEHRFQAEVDQVLGIVINSLYSHREIFLRELISNASDALDRLRFKALTEPELKKEGEELAIRIRADRAKKLLVIEDNGVGMTRDEMIQNLGTIAHSGSKRFLEALKAGEKTSSAPELIGQFGVGFYSAFLVADRVEVSSCAAGTDEAHTWTSEAKGSFQIKPMEKPRAHGTEITLHLKDDADEFADEQRIRHLVRQYSDFVGHPIQYRTGAGAETAWRTINEGSALWKRPRKEIEDAQYDEFYKHLTHDWEPPLARTHFTIEGTRLFTGLLFVPSRPPFDLFDPEMRHGVRLYVKRVFIMDDCKELLPPWLRFVRGVIDSDDLPLNVSRELLQEDRAVRGIKKQLIKKTLELLESVAADKPEDYEKLWSLFGKVLKEGIYHDEDHRERLAKLARFASDRQETTSLSDYVSRMADGQDSIYYLLGPSRNAVEGSPHGEALRRRGYEVLYLTDLVDEFALQALNEFDGKPLVSAAAANLDLADDASETDASKKERQASEEALEPLLERVKSILDDQVAEVRASRRLTESPCCLVVPVGGIHAHVERFLRSRDDGVPAQKRIFELNPEHGVVKRLNAMLQQGEDDKLGEWVYMLYDGALLAEGSPIADAPSYAKRVTRLMGQALGGE